MKKRKIKNYFYLGNQYRQEFRRQVRMFIIFTLGFTLAFTWRETIFDLSKSFVNWLTNTNNPNTTSIGASIFITLICIILILLTSRWFKDNGKYPK